MNFLLHMLGHSYRTPLTLRPSVEKQLRSLAARSLANARYDEALAALSELATDSRGAVADTLARAHLHLVTGDYAAAETFFTLGLERIGDAPDMLDRQIDAGEKSLRHGRYVRATQSFQAARAAVDTLLSAQAGLAVAAARQEPSPTPRAAIVTLRPLANLGDLLLHMLARTHLTSSLADCLRQRELREDLAAWATSTNSVENLLKAEFKQFSEHSRNAPAHAEIHYRLGLVARSLNRSEDAVRAFNRVLAVHPHHLPAAARLAATLANVGQEDAILPTLAVAFSLPPNILEQYAALAAASQTPATFDRAADNVCENLPAAARSTAKANLAFALSELGLLDDARAQWREPALT